MIFEGAWGLPSSSPFCIKLDAWLRLAGLEYEPVYVNTPSGGPKKKAPWIEDGSVTLGDSTLVIEHLSETYDVDLDAGLSEQQKATAWALQTMLEDHYYQVLMYTHFVTDRGWEGQRESLDGAPALLRPIIGAILRRDVRKHLWVSGIGRHEHDEIIEFGKRDMRALATHLGDQKYFFGGEPTSFDACAFGFLSLTLLSTVESDLRTWIERELPQLVEYSQRFHNRFYPGEEAPEAVVAALAA